MAVVLSVSAAEEAAEPTEPAPVPADGAAAEEAIPEEPEIVLNCNANGVLLQRLQLASVTLPSPAPCSLAELLDKVETWSVDCVAQWLENLGFRAQQHPASATAQDPGPCVYSSPRSHARVQRRHALRTLTLLHLHARASAGDLKTPFMGNKVDGAALAKDLSMAKLEEDYGVSDEDQRKKIYGSLKDVMKKDSYTVRPPAPARPPARAAAAAAAATPLPPHPAATPLPPAHWSSPECSAVLACAGQHQLLLADADVAAAVWCALPVALAQVREADRQVPLRLRLRLPPYPYPYPYA